MPRPTTPRGPSKIPVDKLPLEHLPETVLANTPIGQAVAPPVYNGNDDPSNVDDQATGSTITYFENSVLFGTPGSDQLVLDAASTLNVLFMGAGNDVVDAGARTVPSTVVGPDEYAGTVYGGSGDDVITGGSLIDQLLGGSGSDVLNGGGGNDLLMGGFGADTLTGGSGRDIFDYVRVQETGDTIMDFHQGEDVLRFSHPGLAFQGQVTSYGALAANSIGYLSTADGIIVVADLDGGGGTDFAIHLIGVTALQASDLAYIF